MLCRKRISMLIGFKVSSLANKYVFYRPEHMVNGPPLKWNFKVLGMQRWHKPTERVQRVGEKNGLNYLKNDKNQVYFQSYGYTKCKTWLFFFFLLTTAKISHSLGKKFKCQWKIFLTTPFFSSTIWTLSSGTFHFCILRPSKLSESITKRNIYEKILFQRVLKF